MSTPTSLELPDGVRQTTIHTGRGAFAALEAAPPPGVPQRAPALLVPGYTGSKEDFLAVLGLLAAGGRQVVAVDMRGQFETPGADDREGYSASALGADIAALVRATGARHLLGHSYGGLVAREALLEDPGGVGSFTLMSSGPSGLTGPRADELRAMLALLGVADGSAPPTAELQTAALHAAELHAAELQTAALHAAELQTAALHAAALRAAALRARVRDLWQTRLEPQAVAAGVPAPIVAFLAKRMLSNDPDGLVQMARHLLTAPDRTAELARLDRIWILVLYGEDDNSWSPAAQEAMAGRLGASRARIPAAAHSPAVEAPAATASALTQFWDAAE